MGTSEILYTWLGPTDAKTQIRLEEYRRRGWPDDFGPLIRVLESRSNSKSAQYDKIVIMWDTHDPSLYADRDLSSEPLIDGYRSIIESRCPNLSIDVRPITTISAGSPTLLPEIYQATDAVLGTADLASRKTGLLTAGNYVQALALMLLASRHAMTLLTVSPASVDLLAIPLPTFERMQTIFSKAPKAKNKVLLSWIGGPPDQDSIHDPRGPLIRTLEERGAGYYDQIHLIIDYRPNTPEDDKQKLQSAIKSLETGSTIELIKESENKDRKSLLLAYRIETLAGIQKLDYHKNVKVELVQLVDPVNNLTEIYYQALQCVQSESEHQLELLLNSGTKMNSLAWCLLKLWFEEATLIDAWNNGVREVDLSSLSGKPLERFWSITEGGRWFTANDQSSMVQHTYNSCHDRDFSDRLRELWSWLPSEWLESNTGHLASLHDALKQLSDSRNRLSVGSIVLLGALALQDTARANQKNPFVDATRDWQALTNLNRIVVGPQPRDVFKHTAAALFGFLRAGCEPETPGEILVECKDNGRHLVITLPWSAIGSGVNENRNPTLMQRIDRTFRVAKDASPFKIELDKRSTYPHLVRFLMLAQINKEGFGSSGSVFMQGQDLHVIGGPFTA